MGEEQAGKGGKTPLARERKRTNQHAGTAGAKPISGRRAAREARTSWADRPIGIGVLWGGGAETGIDSWTNQWGVDVGRDWELLGSLGINGIMGNCRDHWGLLGSPGITGVTGDYWGHWGLLEAQGALRTHRGLLGSLGITGITAGHWEH